MEVSKMGIPPNNPKWYHFSVEAHRDLGIFQKPPYIHIIPYILVIIYIYITWKILSPCPTYWMDRNSSHTDRSRCTPWTSASNVLPSRPDLLDGYHGCTMGVPWGCHGASLKAREASAKDVRDPFLWQGVGVPSASQHWMVELDVDHEIGGLGPSHWSLIYVILVAIWWQFDLTQVAASVSRVPSKIQFRTLENRIRMQEEQEAVNSFTATKPEIRNTPRRECLAFFSLRTLFCSNGTRWTCQDTLAGAQRRALTSPTACGSQRLKTDYGWLRLCRRGKDALGWTWWTFVSLET